jgi:beta-1,4-mannooligosaccharide/beta-1,4-mannosyl-N-acetylglucosamine phosphorylase
MSHTPSGDVVQRHRGNPIIGLDNMPFRCGDIWNAGAIDRGNSVLLLLTIETLEGRHQIYRAVASDGMNFTIEPRPFMAPITNGGHAKHETLGIREPRITDIDGIHYLIYVAEGDHGTRLGLAKTENFTTVERLGYVSQVDVKGGALFPRKIDGRYAILKRPDPGGSVWVSYSDDLKYWGDDDVVISPRGGYWDASRVGVGPAPVEIDEGWLILYYGVKDTSAGPLLRLGAALLDRDDPSRVLRRSNIPILSPRQRYERIGDVPNIVFSCGGFLVGSTLNVYYGASDSCICLGTADLKEILDVCEAV